MTTYAVRELIEGIQPSLRLFGSRPRATGVSRTTSAPPDPETATVDLVGRPVDEILGERLEAFRVGWSQVTFYLFDPQSWR